LINYASPNFVKLQSITTDYCCRNESDSELPSTKAEQFYNVTYFQINTSATKAIQKKKHQNYFFVGTIFLQWSWLQFCLKIRFQEPNLTLRSKSQFKLFNLQNF